VFKVVCLCLYFFLGKKQKAKKEGVGKKGFFLFLTNIGE
jgi:hypothetical protein